MATHTKDHQHGERNDWVALLLLALVIGAGIIWRTCDNSNAVRVRTVGSNFSG